MAVSTRRIHHRNIVAASEGGEDRSIGGYNINIRQPPSAHNSMAHSTVVLDALSNEDSELARFLLIDNSNCEDGWSSNNINNNNNDNHSMKSIGLINTTGYTMALEPLEIRRERVIMLGESYSIFGALFLGGTWILYEWGSDIRVEDTVTDTVSRIFRVIMAAAFICNISLALFGSYLWIVSIEHSSIEEYVFEARKIIAFCDCLLICTSELVKMGMYFALLLNMYPNWPEIVLTIILAGLIHHYGKKSLGHLHSSILPLEIFHYPYWIKACMIKRNERETLEERAKKRANNLKAKAYRERRLRDPANFDSSRISQTNTNIGSLLRTAAINLGRSDYDVSIFEARLEGDWYNEIEQLKEEDVVTLSRYMPRLLAKEVHNILATGSYPQSRRSTLH